MTLLVPEKKPGIFLGLLIFCVETLMKKHITLARVLIWSPKAAVSSLLLELGIEAASKKITKRMACLVRLKVSLLAHCPFCIDINSSDLQKCNVTEKEVFAIRDSSENSMHSFSEKEKLALRWIKLQTETPLDFPEEMKDALLCEFRPEELVTIAALGAKVNYWARFMQALGIPSEGFQKNCPFVLKNPSGVT